MNKKIIWFRRDLRLRDNHLLAFDADVLPIFIFDINILDELSSDDKRVSYIFYYVQKLKEDLKSVGLDLKIFYGDPEIIFRDLTKKDNFDEVIATPDYDGYAKNRDIKISHILPFRYIEDTYIFKTDEVLKKDLSIYLVFTPYYKKAREILKSKNIDEVKLGKLNLINFDYETISKVEDNGLIINVSIDIENIGFDKFEIYYESVDEKLELFKNRIDFYKDKRDFLNEDVCSNLSVELRFGVLGIRELLRFIFSLKSKDIEPFIRQLIFRDFYAYLLHHFPMIETQNYKYSFNGIDDYKLYDLFCNAQTGVPIVDAGIMQLKQTGKMHNRVRMIVASFFTKDLLLPWQWGEKFFAKYLLDYDKASNVLSWQWSAGTGIDPQPYFRVFNPYLQAKKFDKDAVYIKTYIPELRNIESKHIHNEEYLLNADIKGYTKPIVIHKIAAKKAIDLYR